MISYLKTQFLQWNLPEAWVVLVAYLALSLGVLILAWLANFITKRVLLRSVKGVVKRTRSKWDDAVLTTKLFQRLAHLAPTLIFYLSAPLFEHSEHPWSTSLAHWIRQGSLLAFLLVAVLAASSLLNAIVLIYENGNHNGKRIKPIRSYVQVAKIILFVLAAILVLSLLLNKSPWAFLTGLSAMAAVLILVFKDSILGLVASVQMGAYDTIRVGDWIEMPKFDADGDVIEVALNNIKVQNWDKTIVNIPTAAILTDSVKNWRGMSESGGRRIKRHINIDVNTIKFCNEEMLKRFSQFQYVKDYLGEKQKEIREHNKGLQVDEAFLVNGRHLTNIGTFRAYVEAYLRNHKKIHNNMTFLVRQLQPTAAGLPLEIYVFTTDTRWPVYEAIQADIFDHILAVVPLFDLAVFQETSGQNYKIDIISMPQPSVMNH